MRRQAATGTAAVTAVLAAMLAVPAPRALAAPTAAAAAPVCVTSQLQSVPRVGQKLKGSVPVVFIHGITSSAAMWDATSETSMAGQAALIKDVTAWTFDYARQSLDWVRNRAIGPAFAAAIACLAQASGRKVIVVAHSMGGLATQYAIGYPHSPAVGDVAELITIGTPYQGSKLLSAMQAVVSGSEADSPPGYAVLAEALLSACAGIATHTSSNPCSLVSVLRSPVGTALEWQSPQIQQLPPWPPGLPVLDTAGDIHIRVPVGARAVTGDFGDVPVSLGSATAHDTAGTAYVRHCPPLSLLGAVYLDPGPCYHTHLPNDSDIINVVLAAIRADVQAGILASYVGQWYVHGAALRINPDGSGSMTWNAGPCSQNINVNEGTCTGHASIRFKPLADRIAGTITSVWYTANPGPLPPGFQQPAQPAAGESITLKFTSRDVLYTTYNSPAMNEGNRNWCRLGYVNTQECGA